MAFTKSIIQLSTFSFRAVKVSLIRNLSISSINMTKVGDKIPDINLFEDVPSNKISLSKLSENKKIIIFGVPGAFTPGCSKTHLPGYIEKYEELKKKGISEIVCVSVNDPFVMSAWGNEHKVDGKIRMLADPSAEFTKALQVDTNLPPLGGIRSKRYSMIVDNQVITELNIEPDGTGLSCSLAKNLKV